MRRIALVFVLLPFLIMVGCTVDAVVEPQNFTVTTPPAEGVHCKIMDSLGQKWFISSTPGSVIVSKGYGPLTVICSKEGYKTATKVVNDTGNLLNAAGKYVGNPNPASYPAEAILYLEPLHFSSDGERESWENDQIIREKDAIAAQHQCWFSSSHNC